MKFNKVLENVNVSYETKRYVHNYINESIKSMKEDGVVKEFIWVRFFDFDKYDQEILELQQKNIITMGSENENGILIPSSPDWLGIENSMGFIELKYMLSDDVLLKNGFKTINLKEENNV